MNFHVKSNLMEIMPNAPFAHTGIYVSKSTMDLRLLAPFLFLSTYR